ncbi:heterokaryon incompatibility protein-domain-containing protein [Leptodontidium sp. MPI-SDFR-AT-0119]|nr:heterokaryon incompatibility protein-domain-containing protein [Leptodontidium sp. MPI-SDFR-AT-0119]
MSQTTAFVGLGLRLKAVGRWPLDRLLVWGIKLLASLRTFFNPHVIYKPLETNDLRVLALCSPLTSRTDEPVRCSLHHVSLEHAARYKDWEGQADPTLRLYKKTRAWIKYARDKKAEGDPDFVRSGAFRYAWGDYMTLSYSWGVDTGNSWIIVDGRYVAVTESLDLALRSIQESLSAQDSIRLWVDAICINQQDIAERGGEVRRMRKIYGDSLGGFIHLGAVANDSDLGLQSITSIAKSVKDGFDCRKWLLEIQIDVVDGKENSAQPAIVAVMHLMHRRYWSRMWIIQELAMGQDQLVVCGDTCASLADVRQVLKLLVLNSETIARIVGHELLYANISSYQSTIALLWWIGRVRELILLPEDRRIIRYSELRSPILGLTLIASATDPRDKVYGMMGLLPAALASRVDREDKNYEFTTREVFVNFVKAVIEVTGDLDVIYASHLQQSTLSTLPLPTWATDWTLMNARTAGIDNSVEWYFGLEDEDGAPPQAPMEDRSGPPPRADGLRKGTIRFSDDNELLFCEGIRIGSIQGFAAELAAKTAISASPDVVIQPPPGPNPYGNISAITSALQRTLMLDPSGRDTSKCPVFSLPWFGAEADSNAEDGTFTFGDESSAYFDKLREKGWDPVKFGGSFFSFEAVRRRLGMYQVAGRLFKDYFPEDIPDCPEEADFTAIETITTNIMSRRLVTTDSGHLGLGPATVELGDGIYVLLGSSFPVILRPGKNDGHLEVVGECYVDGFMKGEAIEKLDSGKYSLQQITLC